MSRITYIPPEPELKHPQPPRVRPPVFRKSEAKARLRKQADDAINTERAKTFKRKEDRAKGFRFCNGVLIGMCLGIALVVVLEAVL